MGEGYKPGMIWMLMVVACVVAAASSADAAAPAPGVHDKDHPAPFVADQYRDRAAWEHRRDFLKRQLRVALGLFPMPEKTPLNPVIHGKIERDGYTIEKVYLTSLPGHYVSGNLYRPTVHTGKRPGILSPYGHWPEGRFNWNTDEAVRKQLALGAENTEQGARAPLQARCATLARMGCVVFHYDLVGYADSKVIPHGEGFTDAQAVLRLQSAMGLQTWNGIRAVDFLLSLPDVDGERIGVTGASGGGTQTMMLDALDDRITAAFPVVMVSMNMQGGCVCENAPLLRVGTNNVEIASLFAPKPLSHAAAQDWTHDFERRGLPEMKHIWSLYNAADNVRGKFFPYPHNYNLHSREMMYQFFNERFALGEKSPVKEKPFVPVPPRELSVWDDAHPIPADACDAKTIRRYWTEQNETLVEKMSPDELRQALAAIAIYDRPGACSLLMSPPEGWDGDVILTAGAGEIDAGKSVVLKMTFSPAKPAPLTGTRTDYPGYSIGYNRNLIAQRACEFIDTANAVRAYPGVKRIYLLAQGDSAISALLARAIAPELFDRAAIDLEGFDFDRVTAQNDVMLLPGGLKYGGVMGMVSLCGGRPALVCGARNVRPSRTGDATVEEASRGAAALLAWLRR